MKNINLTSSPLERTPRAFRTGMASSVMLVIVAMLSNSPVHAGSDPFKGISSTSSGFPTWDSDLINVEQVTQTGAGVYVAVLDTGLVPNWRDYFPTQLLKNSALPISPGSATVYDISSAPGFHSFEWELDRLEATGAGLIQADAAISLTP